MYRIIPAKAMAKDGEEITIEKKLIQFPKPGISISVKWEYSSEGFTLLRQGPNSFTFQDGPRCGKMYSVDPVAFPDF